MTRPTRAVIDCKALRDNARQARLLAGKGTLVCAAVKANAYGHGVLPVARELRAEGVEYLGVATVQEGQELRRGGDRGRIMLMTQGTLNEVPQVRRAGLEPVVYSNDYLDALEQGTGRVPVHLKIDTGMNRQGCRPQEALDMARRIRTSSVLELAGVATHFAVSDSDRADDRAFTQKQAHVFRSVLEEMQKKGMEPGLVHAANSGALAGFPDCRFDMVRPGLCLYGYGTGHDNSEYWRPVMEFRTEVVGLKPVSAGDSVSYNRLWRAETDTMAGILPVGYADGYSRRLTGNARVAIGGRVYPVVGAICMDLCMVDLGPETPVRVGDEVVLFGHDGNVPDARELAETTGTIVYEILCSVGQRVPRVYVNQGKK